MNKKTFIICFSALLGLFFCAVVVKNAAAGWLVNSQGEFTYEGRILGKKSSPPGQVRVQERGRGEAPGQAAKNKVFLERSNNKIRVRLQTEEGEVEIPEGTESAEFEIEEPEDKDTIKVRSTGNAFVVIRNKIGAQTHFPLMVNLDTNELIVTTPSGSKTVTILPDAAVRNMLAANVLDQLGGKGGLRWLESQEATGSGTPDEATDSADEATEAGEPEEATEEAETEVASVEEIIELTTTEDGVLAYEITGVKFKKLLGLFKIKLQRVAVVSAETGELLSIREDFLTRLLDILSF